MLDFVVGGTHPFQPRQPKCTDFEHLHVHPIVRVTSCLYINPNPKPKFITSAKTHERLVHANRGGVGWLAAEGGKERAVRIRGCAHATQEATWTWMSHGNISASSWMIMRSWP